MLSPLSDVYAFAEKLKQLMTNEEIRLQMGENAKNRVRTQFSLVATMQKWDSLFQNAIIKK